VRDLVDNLMIAALIAGMMAFASAAQATEHVYDFANGPGPDFTVLNDGSLWSVGTTGPNVSIAKPADDLSVLPQAFTFGGFKSNFSVDGDFTITVDFQLPILNRDLSNSETLNESILAALTTNDQQLFEVLRYVQGNDTSELLEASASGVGPIGPQAAPASIINDGRYRLTRVNGLMSAYYAETGSDAFTLIGTTSGFTGPMYLKVAAVEGSNLSNSNRAANAMSVSYDNLIVDADVFSTLVTQTPPPFVMKWGSSGTGNGQFHETSGIAVDAAGDVYVTDRGLNRVQKFSSYGGYITQWGSPGTGPGQFQYPWGVAVDRVGNVYVSDFLNSRIQKFGSDGTYVAQWGSWGTSGHGQFNDPLGVAVDASGNVYIAEFNGPRIQQFTSSGDFITEWGSYGSGPGQLWGPYGVAVDADGNVYVTDSQNNRIEKFSSNGEYLTQWGSFGTGNGQFNFPAGIAIDATGNVDVVESNNNRIQKFTSNGEYLTQWGSLGAANGQFSYPMGVATDALGNLYVADEGNVRIQKFGPGPGLPSFSIASVTAEKPHYAVSEVIQITVTVHNNWTNNAIQVTPTVTPWRHVGSTLPTQTATVAPGADGQLTFSCTPTLLTDQAAIDVQIAADAGGDGSASKDFKSITVVNHLSDQQIGDTKTATVGCGTSLQQLCNQSATDMLTNWIPFMGLYRTLQGLPLKVCLANQYYSQGRSGKGTLVLLSMGVDAVSGAVSAAADGSCIADPLLCADEPVAKLSDVLIDAGSTFLVCAGTEVGKHNGNGDNGVVKFNRSAAGDSLTTWPDSLEIAFQETGDTLADLAVCAGPARLRIEADSMFTTADSVGMAGAVVFPVGGDQCAAIKPQVTRLFGTGNNPTSAATIKLLADTTGANTFVLFHRQASGDVIKLEYAPIVLDSAGVATIAVSQDSMAFIVQADQDGDGHVDFYYYPGGAVVSVPDLVELETTLSLAPSAPNPMTNQTFLRFSLLRDAEASLVIYNVGGRRVRSWHWLKQTAGLHQVAWDSRDDGGQQVPPGVYFYRLSVNGQNLKQKLVHL